MDRLSEKQEELVFFPCGDISLAGILTIPARSNGSTVLIPWGSATSPSSGRNRVRARLARVVADAGFHAFRFDYQGVGESQGEYRKPDMSKPNTQEIVAACEWLTTRGLGRIVVVAHCFGGWSSLIAAPMISGLEGMALVNSPVRRDHKEALATNWRWWASKLLKLRLGKVVSRRHRAAYRKIVATLTAQLMARWSRSKAPASNGRQGSRFSRSIKYLLNRRIPVLLLYGDDDFYLDFKSELDQGLRTVISHADPPTRVVTVTERLALANLDAQNVLQREILSWLNDLTKATDSNRRVELA